MGGGGGEKTEKATAKKRRDARASGKVRKSTEVNTAVCTIVMVSLMLRIWPWFTGKLIDIYGQYLSADTILPMSEEIGANTFRNLLTDVMLTIIGVMLPIMGTAMLVGVAVNYAQIGFLFTTKTLGMKLSRINPIAGFKRMLSLNSLVELLKSILKISILGYVLYSEYKKLILDFPLLINENIYTAFLGFMDITWRIALKMCIIMAVIGAADYFYQWWKFEKDLRMTKQEVKDEYKQTEGDPQIKGKIRSKQRQMSAMRMLSAVPEADVVITNPTHYAIALKYDDKVSAAPVVIAKGQDHLARKIKEVAIENNIEIVENKPLAQALYAMCEVDDEIPPEFYQAVADVLVFVYKQKQGRRR